MLQIQDNRDQSRIEKQRRKEVKKLENSPNQKKAYQVNSELRIALVHGFHVMSQIRRNLILSLVEVNDADLVGDFVFDDVNDRLVQSAQLAIACVENNVNILGD
jgi:hypothetical protein